MTAPAPDQQLEREIATALAALRAGEARPYYDADSDAEAQARYWAPIDPGLPPAELARALGAHLEATHAPRPPYNPVVHLYPWVDLHPSRAAQHLLGHRP
jgi:endonuclease G, mitochondrial